MKLRSLSLTGFRQHLSTDIQLKDGLTGIIGPNGAGKTTLIEAIAFAFYGSKAIRGKIEDLRSLWGTTGSKLSVKLVFELEGETYRIERAEHDCFLYLGGRDDPIVSGSKDVSSRIDTLLGMSYDEFCNTYLTEQKGLEFLSGKKGTAERERFVVKMMGFDRLEKMHELLRQDKRGKKGEILGLEASLGNREAIESANEKESQEVKELEKSGKEALLALKSAESKAQEHKNKLEGLRIVRDRFVSLKNLIAENSIKKEECYKRLTKLKNERNQILELQDVSDEMRELLENGGLLAEIERSKEELKSLDVDIEEIQLKIFSQDREWREKLISARHTFESKRAEIDNATKRQGKLRSLKKESRCPTCDQELGDGFHKVQVGIDGEIDRLNEEYSKCCGILTKLEKEPVELSSLRKQAIEKDLEKRAVQARFELLQSLESRTSLLSRIDIEVRTLNEELDQLQKGSSLLNTEQAKLNFSEDNFESVTNALEAASRLVEVSRLQRLKLEGELNTKRELLNRTKRELEQYDVREAKLLDAKRALLLLEEGDKTLTGFRKHLNASLRPRLSELASQYMAELTDGRYSAIEISSDFSPTVIEDGEPKNVISGGEEDILNLCVRLALSSMIAERAGQSFSLLILDEVFGSLDEGRRSNVLALLDRLSNRFEQIIVITHLEDIKDGVRNLIYVDYDDASGFMKVGESREDEPLVVNI